MTKKEKSAFNDTYVGYYTMWLKASKEEPMSEREYRYLEISIVLDNLAQCLGYNSDELSQLQHVAKRHLELFKSGAGA